MLEILSTLICELFINWDNNQGANNFVESVEESRTKCSRAEHCSGGSLREDLWKIKREGGMSTSRLEMVKEEHPLRWRE